MRRVSEEGVALIKRFEGLETSSYQDVAGVWTIGYGRTGPQVGPGLVITRAEAEDMLAEDLRRYENAVLGAVRVTLTQSQFDALVSLAYNIGADALRRSTVVRRLDAGDFAGAAEAMAWWNKATVDGEKRTVAGLVRRRAAEVALFLSDAEAEAAERRATRPRATTREPSLRAGPAALLPSLGGWTALRRPGRPR